MIGLPSRDIVEQLRKSYPQGTRVELINMNDPYTKSPVTVERFPWWTTPAPYSLTGIVAPALALSMARIISAKSEWAYITNPRLITGRGFSKEAQHA